MYINAKDEMSREMKLPELSQLKFESIVINQKPFELTKFNLADNFKKQLMQDQLIRPIKSTLQIKLPFYVSIVLVMIIVIFVLYKFKIKMCANKVKKFKVKMCGKKVKKPEDSFLTRHGGVTSEVSADQTLLAETSAVTEGILE